MEIIENPINSEEHVILKQRRNHNLGINIGQLSGTTLHTPQKLIIFEYRIGHMLLFVLFQNAQHLNAQWAKESKTGEKFCQMTDYFDFLGRFSVLAYTTD